MKTLYLLIISILIIINTNAQQIQWQKCLGGSDDDYASSIQQTTDGGYIVTGFTRSSDGDVWGNHGFADYWIVKLNAGGDTLWTKCLGGSNYDYAYSIQQTSDGGYIVAGRTSSSDGDVWGNHGNFDCWIVKLNASGDTLWTRCLGGSDDDEAYSIQQTTDGGYIAAGLTYSINGDVWGNHGSADYWIVKLNANGDTLWTRCLGGSDGDYALSIQQTTDGGYIASGYTLSIDGDVWGNHGGYDSWIVKLDASGDTLWTKCLGGSDYDNAYSIIQTSDGGYIVAGHTSSSNGDVLGNHGSNDSWIVKLNASGDTLWTRCLGGSYEDYAFSIQQTSDGGYIVAGFTDSNNGDVWGNHGFADYWIVKLNAGGDTLWTKCLGGSDDDYASSIQQTGDGGYIVAGYTWSIDGDVWGNHGGGDSWIVKLYADGVIVEEYNNNFNISIYPNPSTGVIRINNEKLRIKNVEVFDIYGKELLKSKIRSTKHEVDLSHQPKGIYIIKVTTSNGVAVEKVILE